MNKQQKVTATKLIEYLKVKNGALPDTDIKQAVGLGGTLNEFTIFGCLEDLDLIKKVGNRSYRLTMNGYNFSSFAQLNRNKLIKTVKENISFILNILLVIVTVYITYVNDGLKDENTILKEDILELKAKQSLLETQMQYYLFRLEKSDTNSIK